MKPETFTESIKAALASQLQAVVLYGSSAAGDYIPGRSDYNLLLLADTWSVANLDAIRAPSAKWQQAGNPAPLCFTPERFRASADVFPMEMLDIVESHRVLHGDDPLRGIEVNPAHLRQQVEFELRSKLLKLRQAYLQLRKPQQELPHLLIDSLSSFQTVCRGALRLFGDSVPTDKLAATRALGTALNSPIDAFESIHTLKAQSVQGLATKQDYRALLARYLEQIETLLDRVNAGE
ncbi:hypothetical protein QEH52_16885 [Coraliomargarita sp. SDUM461003]|uniref:Polymerase nucleotidyl transferase domain-containing protein n=1 Tax=Thalassobacterium maritimum TaxID=3041265 RepID=A0ABU1AYG5_9BACT|nr:hypothetical protein [Coraliomargarita sp. SDUM461003]MDQ8209205.1 hypothetical protein [Coraliomargarita sp. SDUM461003]